jgi:hypothetical protein
MAVNFFPEVGAGGTGSLDDYITLTEKGSANGVATLDSTSKIPSNQLPNISITDTFVVGSQSALLALSAQVGDVAIRTDSNKSFILQSEPASVLGNWVELLTPTDSVLSVDGRTGAVDLADKYQGLNNELTAISALTDTPGFIKKTGDGTYSIDANAYLTNNQVITLSGDVTGSGTTAITATLPNIVTAGSSAKPTYNSKGLVTGSGSLLASDIPTLDSTKITGVVDIVSTQTITGQKTLTGGVIINDTIVESSISATELFTSWDVATGWTISGGNATHTTGVDFITGNLASSLVLNEVYRIALNITNRTVGSITLGFGENSIPSITDSSTIDLPVSTAGNTFSLLPTTDFNGTVSLSVRLINPSSSLVSGINGIKGRFSSTFLGLGTSLYRIQSLSNRCSFMGVSAGQSNTTGSYNSFMGVDAGYANTTGYSNSFMGASAGRFNTTGSSNSFMGVNAGYANTTGYNNSFMGVSAGQSNTTGYRNSFMGVSAGYANTTGFRNSFMGASAGQSNTTGYSNIFLGFEAGFDSTTESNALFIANNRTFTLLKGDGINLATTAVLRVNGTVASTSTTTGAIVTPGGVGVGGALFAQSLNGQLVLNRFTTATRPVASAGTLGQAWLNTTTGKIEYVATSSTIQVITSA